MAKPIRKTAKPKPRLWAVRPIKGSDVVLFSGPTKPIVTYDPLFGDTYVNKPAKKTHAYLCYGHFSRLVGPLPVGEVRELTVRLGK